MAMTPAEKQRAYRERKKPNAAEITDALPIPYAKAGTLPHRENPVDLLLAVVERLYDARSSNTAWRTAMRDEIKRLFDRDD